MNPSKVTKNENFLIETSVFLIIYFPIIWGIGFSYHLYGNLPWPGAAIFVHIGAALTCLLLPKKIKSFYKANKFYFIANFIYIYWGFLYSFFFFSFSSEAYANAAFMQSFVSLFYLIAYIILGYYIFQIQWPKPLVLLLFFIFFLLSLFEINFSSTIPVSLYDIYGDFSEIIPNYQLVSLSILFLSILVYNSDIKLKKTFFLLILTMVFLTGGRSEFLGIVIAITFFISLSAITSLTKRLSIKKIIFTSSILAICISFLSIYIYLYSNIEILNNRNFQIFDLKNASSWQEREYILKQNIKIIFDSPIIGSFGSHFQINEGAYIHNILSVWQQYGLVSFILYFFLLAYPLLNLTYIYFKTENKLLMPPIILSFYCLLLMLVSKSFIWSYAGLSIGSYFYTNQILNKKHR